MRFGLIGLGYWGHNYLRLLRTRPGAGIAVACDLSRVALDLVRDGAGSPRLTTNPDDVFLAADVDAVIVATPASTHHTLVRDALMARKHVLCEKPLAMDVDTCRELVELAGEVGRTLFVGHTFIYNPAIREARRILRAHELGAPLHFYAVWAAPGPVRNDVNALWDLAPHPISILIDLLNEGPTDVFAAGVAILEADREDVVSMHLDFGSGASADVHLSWLAPQKTRTMTITGSRAAIVFDDLADEAKLRIFSTSRMNGRGTPPLKGRVPARKESIPEIGVRVPSLPVSEPLAAQLQHFIDCCERGSLCESGGAAGSDVVRVLESAQHSLARSAAARIRAAVSST